MQIEEREKLPHCIVLLDAWLQYGRVKDTGWKLVLVFRDISAELSPPALLVLWNYRGYSYIIRELQQGVQRPEIGELKSEFGETFAQFSTVSLHTRRFVCMLIAALDWALVILSILLSRCVKKIVIRIFCRVHTRSCHLLVRELKPCFLVG